MRTCVDRLAGDGQHTIADEMEQVRVKGLYRVEIRDAKGRPMTVTTELCYPESAMSSSSKYSPICVSIVTGSNTPAFY